VGAALDFRARRTDASMRQIFSTSEGTVKAHMKSILPWLSARDLTKGVTIAVKRGIIDV
jgi:hypothetical protein